MSIPLHQANVVIPATDTASLRAAIGTGTGAAWDIIEARLDAIADSPELGALLGTSDCPVLLTPRHPSEGGEGDLSSPAERWARIEPLLGGAAAIDIEIAQAEAMTSCIEAARSAGKAVVLSFHDFGGTPASGDLENAVQSGIDLGGDVVKIATRTESAGDVLRLLALFERFGDAKLSVMGMGPLGMASRLLFAQCGSVLNYAAAGEATVEGQWPAAEFRDLLTRTGAR